MRLAHLGQRPGAGLDVVGADLTPDRCCLPPVERRGDARGPAGDEPAHVSAASSSAAGMSVLDVVAERLEQPAAAPRWRRRRRDAVSPAAGAVRQHADAQPARGRRPTSSANGRAGGGATYGSPGSGPCDRRRAAPRESRTDRHDHVVVDEAAHALAEVGRRSDVPGARRLQPDEPAQLAGMRIEPPPSLACADGDHARRDRGRADRRSSRRCERSGAHGLRVGAVGHRLGGRDEAELGRVRLADERRSPARRKRATS